MSDPTIAADLATARPIFAHVGRLEPPAIAAILTGLAREGNLGLLRLTLDHRLVDLDRLGSHDCVAYAVLPIERRYQDALARRLVDEWLDKTGASDLRRMTTYLCDCTDLDVARGLMERGADPNDGCLITTPLARASARGDAPVVGAMLAHCLACGAMPLRTAQEPLFYRWAQPFPSDAEKECIEQVLSMLLKQVLPESWQSEIGGMLLAARRQGVFVSPYSPSEIQYRLLALARLPSDGWHSLMTASTPPTEIPWCLCRHHTDLAPTVVRNMLRDGVDPDAIEAHHGRHRVPCTMLLAAIAYKSTETALALLEGGANPCRTLLIDGEERDAFSLCEPGSPIHCALLAWRARSALHGALDGAWRAGPARTGGTFTEENTP